MKKYSSRSGKIASGSFIAIIFCSFIASLVGFYLAQWKLKVHHHELSTLIKTESLRNQTIAGSSSALPAAVGPVSYADALAKATPAVVSIYTVEVVKYIRSHPAQDWMRRFFGITPMRQQVEERVLPAGVGSGVIVSADGYILTNNHVVTNQRGDEVDAILIQLQDGRELRVNIVGRDPQTDLAVLKAEEENLPFISMADSDRLRVGDVVFAIGNPMKVGQTTTMGIVSATKRKNLRILGTDGYENFIQTDASINPGNSGGALVNAFGELVGINTAIKSQSGGNIGLGFAIPTNMAKFVMTALVETGELQRGKLGVTFIDLNKKYASELGLERTKGVYVHQAIAGLPAHDSGIRGGDIILAVNGKPVAKGVDFRLELSERQPGETIKVTVLRESDEIDYMVKLIDQDSLRLNFRR